MQNMHNYINYLSFANCYWTRRNWILQNMCWRFEA
jgi:hypothetical protein